jgi:serine/threonine-protein kinase
MKLDRWRQLESLYNKALELDESRRVEFLREACAGDDELRREVERLLAARPAASFLEQPALREIVHEFAASAGPSHQDHQDWIGREVGNYQFVSLVGVGGMGEVYRARDTKLKREVAIKVIPDEFSRDPARISRFQREAQLLASLNHPNIAAIYDLEELNGSRLLILEMVPGETLADRIRRGPIPLEEALKIALQIAEALEAAHERNVIHRDLKPANIKVTAEATVKVLDFGLAKALADERPAEDTARATASMTATIPGVILGTAAYMSPEQATGKAVDRRADIWAFGVVLFELLTGKPAFQGEDVTEILTAVMSREPAHDALPAKTPAAIRNLLHRCLEKNLKRRLQHMGEARILIEDTLSSAASAGPAGWAGPDAVPRQRRERLAWAAAAALALIVIALAIGFVLLAPKPPQPLQAVRLSAEIGADATLYTELGPSTILSPDGTWLAFVAAGPDRKRHIYVRSLDQLQATALPGTENARDPFFSPNGLWIGFFADGKLKTISVRGGPATTLCDAINDFGGSWGDDDRIVFAKDHSSGLSTIFSAGGTPQPLISLDSQPNEVTQRWPQVLPGSQAVLFTSNRMNVSYFDNAEIVVYSIASGKRKTVQRGGFHARYLPSGHLAYVHEGTLFAVPFDLQRLDVTGQPVPVLEGVATDPVGGGAQFSFSDTGKLVYVASGTGGPTFSIYWMDREGKFTPLYETPGHYGNPRFSPDGKRLALQIFDGRQGDIWVYELESDALRRLTFGGNGFPVWTPDGKRITYLSVEKGVRSTYWIRADGVGAAERLLETKPQTYATSWRPDGRVLAFNHFDSATLWDVMTLTIEGDEKSGWKPGELKAFVNSPLVEGSPAFSPDGGWIAYHSESGSGGTELYVRPFPGPGRPVQISTGGGRVAKWSPNGKELFYNTNLTKDSQIMVVTYTASGDSFTASKPRLWSPAHFDGRGFGGTFDLHPDGKRFAVLKEPATEQTAAANKVNFIFDFFDELRTKFPGKN